MIRGVFRTLVAVGMSLLVVGAPVQAVRVPSERLRAATFDQDVDPVIVPLSVWRGPREGGYATVYVGFALQNPSDVPARFTLPPDVSLSIAEGRSYDGHGWWACGQELCGWGMTEPDSLPAGITICGVSEGQMVFYFETVPQDTTPSTLTVPGFGDYDLAGLPTVSECPESTLPPAQALPVTIPVSGGLATGSLAIDTMRTSYDDSDGFQIVLRGTLSNDSKLDPLLVPALEVRGLTSDGTVGTTSCSDVPTELGPSQSAKVELCLPGSAGARGRVIDYDVILVQAGGIDAAAIAPEASGPPPPTVKEAKRILRDHLDGYDFGDGRIDELRFASIGRLAILACAHVTFAGSMEGDVVQPYWFVPRDGDWRVLDTFHDYFTSQATMSECLANGS